jgi:hypothetical protein
LKERLGALEAALERVESALAASKPAAREAAGKPAA